MADEQEKGAETAPLKFNLQNNKLVELYDLTSALTAFGDAYQEYVKTAAKAETGNLKLLIKELKSGSVIAEIITQSIQKSFVTDHAIIAAGFITHFQEITEFLSSARSLEEFLSDPLAPTRREAESIVKIMQPVAKDSGSQLFLHANRDIYINFNHSDATNLQQQARRFLAKNIPVDQDLEDQILTLEQVRGDPSARVGDRGIIEEVSTQAVRLRFASDDVKSKILEIPYPFQKLFLVDISVKTSRDKIIMYLIKDVKDAFDR